MKFTFLLPTISLLILCLPVLSTGSLFGQQADWQQRVNYTMDIVMDVETNRFTGTQQVEYTNASPDTLFNFYYHLYYNAFQPGSMMDTRSRSILDPDGRVMDRISRLNEDEIGWQMVHSLSQNGTEVSFTISETNMIVHLSEPILPGETVVFDMEFEAQVPLQIRRTGRDNREDIRYSMAQWYPRVAAYDSEGWHTAPYIAREFHGSFGDFDVKITIDRNYTLGATGYLQNPQQVGHGYENPDLPLELPTGENLTWHFFAPDVIDFFWGADDKFVHVIHEQEGSPRIHMLYVERPETRHWQNLGLFTAEAFRFMNEYIGPYPYEQFTIIQGGDGGMEYPMGTLITGHRSLYSLVAVTVHELIHMWFQSTLATNESLHHWMDEGFTVYMSELTMRQLFNLPSREHESTYLSYLSVVHLGLEEPMGQQADRFETNQAYVMSSYRKGSLILHQLEYIIGEEALRRTLRRYYNEWVMRHPTPRDFQHVAERESGMQLGWYFDEMLHSTRTIDMAIDRVRQQDDEIHIRLRNRGSFHMPVDLLLTYEDGSHELINIPTQRQLGTKETDSRLGDVPIIYMHPWPWTSGTYEFSLNDRNSRLISAEIDPSLRLADINRLNNRWPGVLDLSFLRPATPDWSSYQAGFRPAFWYGENAGIRAGARLSGAYLFNTRQLDAEFWLTTGTLEEPFVTNINVDYRVAWRDRFTPLGPGGWWFADFSRFYGISHATAGLERSLGRYGSRSRHPQLVQVFGYRLEQSSDRLIPALQQNWERGVLWGLGASYHLGERSGEHGLQLELHSGTFDQSRAAHQLSARANYSLQSRDFRYRIRFGMQAATASIAGPAQIQNNLGSGTALQQWQSVAFNDIANTDALFFEEARLSFDSGNALSGFSVHAPEVRGLTGSHMLAFSIWQFYRPFLRGNMRAFELELFAGTGQAWGGGSGAPSQFEIPSPSNPWLASAGAGLVFDASELPGGTSRRWIAQSRLLQDLRIALRSPFYLSQAGTDQNNFEPISRWMIGVGRSF
ncbi:MAG: M1 family metallopeptidase [Balneolales bacterium]|nr:M1 family metallopeptidase [Balneolales bacterium]